MQIVAEKKSTTHKRENICFITYISDFFFARPLNSKQTKHVIKLFKSILINEVKVLVLDRNTNTGESKTQIE